MDKQEEAEFERIRLTARVERDLELIDKYEEGMRYVREDVAKSRYDLGRLDERLGGRAR